MLPLYSVLNIDHDSPQPIYVQLSNSMIHLIQKGILKPGSRLPSIREMAKELKLHRKTIVAAYDEMAAQDWVYSKPRSGIIVSEHLPELKPRTFKSITENKVEPEISSGIINSFKFKYIINDGFPDYRIAPIEQLLKYYKNAFYYGDTEKLSLFTDPAGSPRLRHALSKYISASRIVKIKTENILITRGAQMAIYIAASLLIKPGDYVYVGEPGYGTANKTFEQLGAKLIKVPVDENGIDVDALEKKIKTKRPKLLYIIPHHHHPTTVTLSAARRMKLLSLIRQHQFYVIEDDYDYEFHYSHNPILPLASADHDGYVLYVGSITKNLSYSFRVGYLVASEKIISKATAYKSLMDIRGDLLLEDALATLYENGTMQRHIRKSVKLYHERRDMFCDLLKQGLGSKVNFNIPAGGMAVWTHFNKKYSLSKISALAATKGLWMKDGSFYNTGDINHNALRMGFASLEKKEMIKIIEILSQIM